MFVNWEVVNDLRVWQLVENCFGGGNAFPATPLRRPFKVNITVDFVKILILFIVSDVIIRLNTVIKNLLMKISCFFLSGCIELIHVFFLMP